MNRTEFIGTNLYYSQEFVGDMIKNYNQEIERLKEILHWKQIENNIFYKSRCEKAIEYITSYESISTIQGLDKIEQNKTLDEKTMNIMVYRYLEVHDKLLDILTGGDE